MALLKKSVMLVTFCLINSIASRRNYTDEELKCMRTKGQQLYSNKGEKKCYMLRKQGPCNSGEWFVRRKILDSEEGENVFEGVCKQDRCRGGEYFWEPENRCVKGSEVDEVKRLCGSSPVLNLSNDDFGDGVCKCQEEPPHSRLNGDPEKECYQLFSQGPCERWEIFAYLSHDSLNATCFKDPCYEDNNPANTSGEILNSQPFVLYNGKCHQLNTTGPCLGDGVLQFNALTHHVDCLIDAELDITNRIGLTSDCIRGSDSTCKEEIRFPKSESDEEERIPSDAGCRRTIEYLKCKRDKKSNCSLKSSDVACNGPKSESVDGSVESDIV